MSINISNGQYVNIIGGEVRVTAFAENVEGRVKIFSIPFSTPTGGMNISLDTILGRNRDINDIFNKNGGFAGSTLGKEKLVDKTGSINLKDDYVYLSSDDSESIVRTKSLMRALSMSDMFTSKCEVNGTRSVTPVQYKVVGTNGVSKEKSVGTGDKIYGLLTNLDGRLIIPQAAAINAASIESITTTNSRITAYNKSSICVMFEILVKFDETKSEGYRFVYTLNSNFKYQEQDEANEVSFDQMMLSDVRYITKFFFQGLSTGETGAGVPARVVKVGTNSVRMFKAPIGTITYSTGNAVPSVSTTNLATNKPTYYIDANFALQTYTPGTGDICIGFKTISSKSYYFLLKFTGTVWEFIVNTLANTTNLLTLNAVNTPATDADLVVLVVPVTYECYDFNFELEDFSQV